ncbi:TPA: hypothetical protein QDB02_003958 [Burkholderia vietnamiensis]|nr:hypothetical protein [Burkholderia vietnamiensis]
MHGRLGKQADLNADYVAKNDATSQALAARIVDTLDMFAARGAVDVPTVCNVLKA